MAFVHLHTHSEYSLLDGANRIVDLVRHVKTLGMDSLAVTDHGNLHAAWAFYDQAKSQKLRPILGFEAYLAFGSRRQQQKAAGAPAPYSHLVLLAKNRVGYQNLIKLSSIGYTEGFYRRPRIDKEVLAEHHEGIVCLAACLSGEIALWLRQGNYEEARRSAAWFAQLFGKDDFWLEIQKHGIAEENIVTEGMLRLSQDLGLGVVATNDAHYLRREDAEAHDVLLAIGTETITLAILEDVLVLPLRSEKLLSDGGSYPALAGFLLSVPWAATSRFLSYIDGRTRQDAWDVQVRIMALGGGAA